jgi:hypothetical protein
MLGVGMASVAARLTSSLFPVASARKPGEKEL